MTKMAAGISSKELAETYEDDEKQLPEFDEQDYSSHRNVYVGVHIPYSVPKHRKHHHHHHHKKKSRKRINIQDGGRTTPLVEEVEHLEPRTPADPCDRVKFILGGDDAHGDGPDSAPKHSIFTELEELRYGENGQKPEWKETARWVKFEEDIEEGGEKWSKPHVATLSLHSLFELRSCILKGTVMLDVSADGLAQISDYVIDNLVASKQLEEANREKVLAALLQRHKHHYTKDHEKKRFPNIRSLGDIVTAQRKHSEDGGNGGLRNWFGRNSLDTSMVNSDINRQDSLSSQKGFPVSKRPSEFSQVSNMSTNTEESHQKFDQHFMKKLAPGSEASNVLIGEVDFLNSTIIAFVRLSEAKFLGDLTEVPIPTRFMFILLGPQGNHERYHEVGRAIATLMSDEVFHEVAYKARNRGDLLAGIDEFLDQVTVLPPGEWDPQIRLEPPSQVPSQTDRMVSITKDKEEGGAPPKASVTCLKIPLQGLLMDARRRYKHYLTDFRDAFWDTSTNKCSVLSLLTTIASIVFIYFANIAPAITFGLVLSDKTGGLMGATEMILSVGIGNVVYAMTAGQPLVVLGGTGPTLIFEDILYRFASQRDIPYLEFRSWIGMWTGIFLIVLVFFNVSVMIRLFTRFTEEIFSALISFIFIYEAFEKVWNVHLDYAYSEYYFYPSWLRVCDCYQFYTESDLNSTILSNATKLGSYYEHYRNLTFIEGCSRDDLRAWVGESGCSDTGGDVSHNVFFFSILLFFGTFLIAFYLKKFKETPFFPATVRRVISDFAVLISVVVWVLVNFFAHVDGVPTLTVPNILGQGGIYNEESVRKSFLINPLGNGLPQWAPVAAIIPALLATILLFMDQQITALVVNRKDNKLKKGSGYHLDMFIVALLIIVYSFFGLPWVVGATVRSIAHVQSLFLYSPSSAPGERPKFLGVKEQRVTLLSMGILLGISVLLYQVLQLLPLAVLYGLFLYIGVASLNGIQFVQRIMIIFMPDKYKPDEEYVRHIPNRRLHLYTLVQVLMLCVLCIFKVVSQISIVFPIMVLLLVIGRWLVGWCFPKKDLEILDDPIPEELYCGRRCCKRCPDGSEMEKRLHSSDNRSEEVDGNGAAMIPNNSEGGFSTKSESHINITQEMDRCDLWRHMVHNLDSEPASVSSKKQNGGAKSKADLNDRFDEEVLINSSEPILPSHKSLLYQSTEV